MFCHLYQREQSTGMSEIRLVRNHEDIDKETSRTILVESFICEYQKYLQPNDIGDNITSWREGENSVEQFYQNYFTEELEEFSHKELDYWVQAYINDKLVGWATFVHEENAPHSVYMNLLVVHPDHQGKGIGSALVNALVTLNEIPNLNTINLYLRKKNQGGRAFYSKLGFFSNPEYKRPGNFVDHKLLEGFTWRKPTPEPDVLQTSEKKGNKSGF